jgi:hypothetical protein
MNVELELDFDTPETGPPAVVSTALVEVLGADVELPMLIKFVPDARLRAAADNAAAQAMTIVVQGADGLAKADVAATMIRATLKAIEQEFKDPKGAANALHKRLTRMEAEWRTDGEAALKTINARMFNEQQRIQRVEAEDRRRQQEIVDREAREIAQQQADAAKAAQAPAEVIEELTRAVETASAPPVMTPTTTTLAGSTPVGTWKARLLGTTGDQEANPEIENLTAAQKVKVRELLRALLDETNPAPWQAIKINWSYLNARAKADKSTMRIAGLEAFQEGSMRGKGGRGAR